ncbi:MAG: hypothetical protein R6U98_05350 [Pirellulaceae bacterium]
MVSPHQHIEILHQLFRSDSHLERSNYSFQRNPRVGNIDDPVTRINEWRRIALDRKCHNLRVPYSISTICYSQFRFSHPLTDSTGGSRRRQELIVFVIIEGIIDCASPSIPLLAAHKQQRLASVPPRVTTWQMTHENSMRKVRAMVSVNQTSPENRKQALTARVRAECDDGSTSCPKRPVE